MESLSRDNQELERLDPDQNLVERRRARDEEDYRSWCESTNGMVALGEEIFHPADVLDKLAPDAARRGRDDAALHVRTELEQTVCEQFPAAIAIPFHGFLEGPRQSLQRLHRLRDTWEALVRILAALALSEAAGSPASLGPLSVREGKDQGWRECRRRDLCSDKLSVRIGLIEGVLHWAQQKGVELHVASLVPLEVLAEVRRLNVIRNGFSHEATKSDTQAKAIIAEAYPVMREVLLDLRDIQSVELLRIHGIQTGGRAEVEKLTGHAQSRRIHDLHLEPDAASLAMTATNVDGMSRVLARMGGLTLDLSPFLYTIDDDTGHRTRIFDFKSKRGDDWQLECVADSTTKLSPAAQHEGLLVRYANLLAPSGEGA